MKIQLIMCCLSILILTGCANKNPVELSQSGPTVRDILEMRGGVTHAKHSNREFRALQGDLNYRSVDEYANRRVPNPEMILFIYPRRESSSGGIVQGYEVRFPMYQKVHYSLYREVDDAAK